MDGGNTHHDTGGGEAEEGLPRGGDSRHMDNWDSSRSLGTAVDRSIEGVRGDRAAGRDGRGGGGRRHCLPFRRGSSLLCSKFKSRYGESFGDEGTLLQGK